MKDYPREKYKIFSGPNKVVAVSSYAGRKVRGVAKCAPGDTFNLEKGKDLAIARCAFKIAKKRQDRATQKLAEAILARDAAEEHLERMINYANDSEIAVVNIEKELKDIMNNL